MLGFIPKLYPDELLYSFIARYHAYSLNLSTKHTANELFKDKRKLATPDLPINLNGLHVSIIGFWKVDVEELVCHHTFFNFYTNFIGCENKLFVKNAIYTGKNKGAIHMKTGVMASGIKEKTHFYYCVNCANEEIQQLGETYWHLSHQLPGVLVCTKHKGLLKKSNIEFRSKKRFELYTASEGINVQFRSITDKPNNYKQLLQIANECIILANQGFNFELKKIQEIYKTLLLRQGYIKGYGMVNQQKLANDFESFYGKEALKRLQSSVCYENPSCWLKAITRKHRKAFHPLRHILFILFLTETLESIEEMDIKDEFPFGVGPFPCLNKAANHFHELVITDVEIKVCRETKLPNGIFKCKCGYQYSRKGHDKNKDDLYKIDRVIQYGERWLEEVDKLINKEKLSYRSVARRLGVDTNTIIKYSRNPFSLAIKKKKDYDLLKMVDEKKKEWFCLINDNPNLGVTKIRAINPALYSWLYRNCKDWLQDNSPMETKKHKFKRRIDWEQRDFELVKDVERMAEDLLERKPPVRITSSLIGSEIGKRTLLQKHINSLPKTKNKLMVLIEDIPTFQIRRIQYIVAQLKEQNQSLTKWLILRKAGLKDNLDSRVENAIEEVMEYRK